MKLSNTAQFIRDYMKRIKFDEILIDTNAVIAEAETQLGEGNSTYELSASETKSGLAEDMDLCQYGYKLDTFNITRGDLIVATVEAESSEEALNIYGNDLCEKAPEIAEQNGFEYESDEFLSYMVGDAIAELADK